MIDANTERPPEFPAHLWGGFMRYVLHGIPPGSFLRAFFEGNLHDFCRRSGGQSDVEALWPMVVFLHNKCPIGCYGSFDRVQDWIDNGGLEGLS